jgi:hypothetical protein
MSKKINPDIKKWHREISELIKSKNNKNYDFIFVVPNDDTLHEFGCAREDERFGIYNFMFFNTLFNHVFTKYKKLKDNKNCFFASCDVDHHIDFLKDQIHQKIKKHVKKMEQNNDLEQL